jgi:GH15 family glucan-1,4-alpha-glucosidase
MTDHHAAHDRYPPLGDYALVGDCRSAALVSRDGAVDWCCMPRMDAGSLFARMLDWDRGGSLELGLASGRPPSGRRYLDGTMVLETDLTDDAGAGVLLDCMTAGDGAPAAHSQLLRVVECRRGSLELAVRIAPRFDYGGVRPWVRLHEPNLHSAVGGDDGLVIFCDRELELEGRHDLIARVRIRAGERLRLSLEYVRPEELEREPPRGFDADELDRRLEATIDWWRCWHAEASGLPGPESTGALRSALVLKALQYEPTGAIVAAPTTSLPEAPGGARNWDYRFSWVRDSSFAVRSLAELGRECEADAFRRFVQRSSAGNAEDLQVVYGIGGERRLVESELDLEGWRGARPVRVGNAASGQIQLDALGELLNLAWRWHLRGHSPDDDLWRFIVDLVDAAAARWDEPDAGIWEWRGDPKHFVHSKAMCWSALDKGLRLAEECMRKAPERRWARARDEVRGAIEERGFERRRGTFVQAFGSRELDAAVLLLPTFDFVDWADERMLSTVDVLREGLDDGHGLLLRYSEDDRLGGTEGALLACTFWLAECLAHQGRLGEAQETFDRALATSNDLGLFGEEYWSDVGEIAGNFPQGLTHLAHIAAAVALGECRPQTADVSAA